MKRKSASLRRKTSTLLIAAGLAIIFFTMAATIYTHMRQQKLYEDFLANQEKLELSYQQAGYVLAQSSTDSAVASQAAAGSPASSEIQVIGKIKIPSIDVDLLLVEGVGAKELRMGAGHFPQSALPGENGNCAIAGHRNYSFGSMFNRLDEVEKGDLITIEQGKKIDQYRVTDTFVVVPEDLSVLKQDSKKQELTLVTCTPVRAATHRLIIRSELIP